MNKRLALIEALYSAAAVLEANAERGEGDLWGGYGSLTDDDPDKRRLRSAFGYVADDLRARAVRLERAR